MYLAPWQDHARRTAATVAPRQLIKASPYLREVEANLNKLADRRTLIVWGEADFAFGEPERLRFEQVFPKHQTVLFANASHFLQEDEGERIAEAIRNFCKSSV
jgi:haloalkane dehalogenase